MRLTIEPAGLEPTSISEFVGQYMAGIGDRQPVIADPEASCYGAATDARGIGPGANPRLGPTRFED